MTATRPKQPALFDVGPDAPKPKRVRRKVPLYRDCPQCPSCDQPFGTPVAHSRGYHDNWLCCAHCGHEWNATAEATEQAWRAYEAWERFCDRKARV
jgi:transcription elongation factor Elf1